VFGKEVNEERSGREGAEERERKRGSGREGAGERRGEEGQGWVEGKGGGEGCGLVKVGWPLEDIRRP
jgi:hypothetical protein